MMRTSSNGVAVMHYFEQCRLLAYPDPGSPLFRACQRAGIDPYRLRVVPATLASFSGAPWTIGWGDTGNAHAGLEITRAEADARFERRLEREFEPMANRALARPVSQGAFDGFVSGLYNVGPGQAGKRDGLIVLASGAPSTFLRRLNAGDELGAFDALQDWNRAGGLEMLGLKRRRAAERALAHGKTGAEAIAIGAAIH